MQDQKRIWISRSVVIWGHSENSLRNFTLAQAAFDGHGFAGRTAESTATATSLSVAPTSPRRKGHPRQGDHPSGSGLHVRNTHSGGGGRGRCIRIPFLSLEEMEDSRSPDLTHLHLSPESQGPVGEGKAAHSPNA